MLTHTLGFPFLLFFVLAATVAKGVSRPVHPCASALRHHGLVSPPNEDRFSRRERVGFPLLMLSLRNHKRTGIRVLRRALAQGLVAPSERRAVERCISFMECHVARIPYSLRDVFFKRPLRRSLRVAHKAHRVEA